MPSVPCRIRPATRADRPTLLTFHHALYVAYRDKLLDAELAELYAYKDLDEALADDVDAILANRQACVLIAEDPDGTPVGYITGHIAHESRRVLATRGVVEDWFVVPAARGTGCGRALMDAILAIFREAGCTAAESATWPVNAPARRLHERLGFREIEVRYRMKLT